MTRLRFGSRRDLKRRAIVFSQTFCHLKRETGGGRKAATTTSYPDIIFRPLATSEDVLPYNAVWLPGNDNSALWRFFSPTRSLPETYSPEGDS